MASHLLLIMNKQKIEIRRPSPDQLPAFSRAISIGFGGAGTFLDEQLAHFTNIVEATYPFAAFDGDQIVGSLAYIDYETVNSKARISTAGITMVTVSPTHRRRGILSKMMPAAMAEAVERGHAMASLYASEPAIYGRFGYGVALFRERYKISRNRTALAITSKPAGEMRYKSAKDGISDAREVFEKVASTRPGWIIRSSNEWKWLGIDPEWDRNDDSELHTGIYYVNDSPEGYVNYRRTGDGRDNMRIIELVGVDRDAELALWNYCFGIDLVGEIQVGNRPVDDALPWMLQDTRALERIPQDCIWSRILDVPTVLESRAYSATGDLSIKVIDESGGYAAGTYLLSGSGDGATCVPTDKSPELTMNVAILGSITFGGTRPSVLGRSGLIDENAVGSLSKADAMFVTQKAPWNVVDF
jgi:predicted acetyltransferase